jgi:hypothetical protein
MSRVRAFFRYARSVRTRKLFCPNKKAGRKSKAARFLFSPEFFATDYKSTCDGYRTLRFSACGFASNLTTASNSSHNCFVGSFARRTTLDARPRTTLQLPPLVDSVCNTFLELGLAKYKKNISEICASLNK